MGITKPTLADPFAKTVVRKVVPQYKEPLKPQTDEEKARNFVPSHKYYVNDMMKDMVAQAVVDNELSLDDLPFVYELASLLAHVQRRGPSPTDLEGAIKIRTIERLEKMAKGEVKQQPLQIVMGPMLKHAFESRWKQLADAAFEQYKENHKCDNPVQ